MDRKPPAQGVNGVRVSPLAVTPAVARALGLAAAPAGGKPATFSRKPRGI